MSDHGPEAQREEAIRDAGRDARLENVGLCLGGVEDADLGEYMADLVRAINNRHETAVKQASAAAGQSYPPHGWHDKAPTVVSMAAIFAPIIEALEETNWLSSWHDCHCAAGCDGDGPSRRPAPDESRD